MKKNLRHNAFLEKTSNENLVIFIDEILRDTFNTPDQLFLPELHFDALFLNILRLNKGNCVKVLQIAVYFPVPS